MLLANRYKQTMASFKIDDILKPKSDTKYSKYSIFHIINNSNSSNDKQIEQLNFSQFGDFYRNSKTECKSLNFESDKKQKKHGNFSKNIDF
jgi:hypothetical protein